MYIAGIDEVGRGPLAGPVSVGVVWVKKDLDIKELFPGVTDSKKLSEKKREEIYEKALTSPDVAYVVASTSPKDIDAKGIEWALRTAIAKCCSKLPEGTFVYLDGRLKAPETFKQETVVGGDLKIPAISLASIVAKVERDRYMKKISEDYPMYGFHKHKGYGTKAHMEAIAEFGLSEVHRASFCKNVIK
jgi:ribonuclease HII